MAAEILLKAKFSVLQRTSDRTAVGITDIPCSGQSEGEEHGKPLNINDLYKQFEDYLGDSISVRLSSEGFHVGKKPEIGVTDDKVSLYDLVNNRVVFNGSRFERKKERTEEDENEAEIRFLSRPPKLGGYGREGLRKRPGKVMKRPRSRSQSFKEAFPLSKTVKKYGTLNLSSFLSLPGYIEPLPIRSSPLSKEVEEGARAESTLWKVSQKMKPVGKRKMKTIKASRLATPFYLGMLV